MEATLQRIYDEENAPSAYQLYKLARKEGHSFTKEKVDEFVKNRQPPRSSQRARPRIGLLASSRPPPPTRSGNSTCSIAAPSHPSWTGWRRHTS